MSNEEVNAWQDRKSPVSLGLGNLPQLKTLPEGLQYLTAIQNLYIDDCDNLRAIPEWISNLTSLAYFRISSFPNLTSLPECIHSMISLLGLSIRSCPILLLRCRRGKGKDWPKIAHILYLDIETDDESQSYISSGVSIILQSTTIFCKQAPIRKSLGAFEYPNCATNEWHDAFICATNGTLGRSVIVACAIGAWLFLLKEKWIDS
ncbi:hypothetical protein FNV43_RR05713 [Rhamnella rubrinervis]|uniref:Uncharacterized protein n=1 Tax=Rhamnella rubrinervis TaxID=2594499 RepID=A0A8K0HPB0_9ROSA|nr:hypothetical protein FNV43_RR05713 [Rhamnella rubrinervis]